MTGKGRKVKTGDESDTLFERSLEHFAAHVLLAETTLSKHDTDTFEHVQSSSSSGSAREHAARSAREALKIQLQVRQAARERLSCGLRAATERETMAVAQAREVSHALPLTLQTLRLTRAL